MEAKDVAVRDLYRTLDQIERTLREAGTTELKCYHSPRDAMLQKEFIKMADNARASLEFADSVVVFLEDSPCKLPWRK